MLSFIRKNKRNKTPAARIYITGDKHRDFRALIRFCKKNRTTPADTIIILGDACFNYFGDERDDQLKQKLTNTKVTLFCIHGNKENRPQNIATYKSREYRGGIVYFEPAYPNILFAKDCEIYDFCGHDAIVIGGSHSVDKYYRLENALPYWFDEEPDERIMQRFENIMQDRNWEIEYIFSHTVPLKYEPTEVFISNKKKPGWCLKKAAPKRDYVLDIDKSVEQWLDRIESKTHYQRWFAGHYHTDKKVDRLTIMQHEFENLTRGEVS